MRKFDVYRNPSPRSLQRAPFVLVLPDRRLLELPVTIVAPVVDRERIIRAIDFLFTGI